MFKHTPGKWLVENDRWVMAEGLVPIAVCSPTHVGAEANANAHLVAAAPEMFDILNAMILLGILDPNQNFKEAVIEILNKASGK